MKDERKKPLWPWIVALLIGLPVLYVASFGPFTWICDQYWSPNWMSAHWHEVYAPVLWLADKSPLFKAAVFWPAELCRSIKRSSG